MRNTAGNHPDVSTVLTPGALAGAYRVIEVLGRGRRATAYLARHITLDSVHVLKVMDGKPEAHLAFASVLARFTHPGAVRVHDVFSVNGQAALVLEHVAGPGLEEWLRTHQPDTSTRLTLFGDIARTVGAAHGIGLGYLDPANVRIEEIDGMFSPRVLGFRSATEVDPADDLFVLGRVLHALIGDDDGAPKFARYLAKDLLNPAERPRDVAEVLRRLEHGEILDIQPFESLSPITAPLGDPAPAAAGYDVRMLAITAAVSSAAAAVSAGVVFWAMAS